MCLTTHCSGFLPPEPFSLIEQDGHNPIPDRVYTKAELLAYLHDCRQKCRTTLHALTDEQMERRCEFSWGTCSFFELLIYNLRHVQGHTAQLEMVLGQHIRPQSDYVTQALDDDVTP